MTFLREMNELGIKPEHECFDSGHIANLDPLIDMGLLREPLQISCVMGVTGGIRPNARNLAHMSELIDALKQNDFHVTPPISAHRGEGRGNGRA